MIKKTLSQSNLNLFLSIGSLNHSILLARQRELNQFHIPLRQYQVLNTIQDLGPKATLTKVAKRVEREVHVVSRQIARMEKDGLLSRTKITPKSNLLTLELTKKGIDIINIGRQRKSIDSIFSVLSEKERQQMEAIINRMSTRAKEYNSEQKSF